MQDDCWEMQGEMKVRVLIVEDEIKIRTGISKLISAHTSHTVIGEAKNGREGLELILRLHPDLVISDIRMPGMEGLEMLETAVKAGIHCHFVVLSGYSEFEYAQKALRCGVDDYLLKPLAPEDVTELLAKIQKRIDLEEAENAQTAEGLIRDVLLGGKKEMLESCRKLERTGVFQKEMPIVLAAGYIGCCSAKYVQALPFQWEKMKEKYPNIRMYYVTLENTQEMLLILQGEFTCEEWERKLNRRVYQNLTDKDEPVWTIGRSDTLEMIQETLQKLRGSYLYGMCIGYREILTEEKIQRLTQEEFQYPLHIESRMQTAICRESTERFKKETEAFLAYTRQMKCAPRYIRKTYKKMLAFLENVCHEVNPEAYKTLQNLDLEKAASGMLTFGELESCFRKAAKIILESKDKKEDIRNYAIRRAINYIREHYSENISLDMLADRLEITPEYLSALFNKEVGINFSTFLKRFRISQAKRLLKGTDEKIYSIAQQVGYHDPKYFNRVFKEEIGVSPGDYRQNN